MMFIVNTMAISIDSVAVTHPPCAGTNSGMLVPTVTGSVGTVSYSWSPSTHQVGANILSAPAGTYTLLVTDDVGSDTWTGDLIDPTPVSITYSESSFIVCDDYGSFGDPVKYDPNGYYGASGTGGTGPYTYAWTAALGSFDNQFDLNTFYYPPVGQPVRLLLTAYDSSGCGAAQYFDAVVNKVRLTYDFVAPTTTGGSDGRFTNIVVNDVYTEGGFGHYTWRIYDTDGTTILASDYSYNGPIPDLTGLTTGTYRFDTVTGCGSSDPMIMPEPLIVTLPENINYCDSSDFVTIVDGSGPFTYSWSPTVNLNDPSARLPGFTYSAEYPIIYTLTVTGGDGQMASDTVQVNGLTLDVGTGVVDICGDVTASLPLTVSGGVGPYSYVWSPSTYLNNPRVRNPIVSVNGNDEITYTVLVTDSAGCRGQAQVSMSAQNPQITYSTVQPTCGNIDGQITIVGGSGCEWVDGSTECSRTGLPAGQYVVAVTDSCESSTQLTIEIVQPIFPDSDSDGTVDCLDECPNDANKIEPGVCGCGTVEIDEDGDGVPSCIDRCDTDPRLIDEACRTVIVIPPDEPDPGHGSGQGSDGQEQEGQGAQPTVTVSIPQDTINVAYNVSDADGGQIDQIEVQALPLSEVDMDGTVVQSLDLNSLKWRNVLVTYDGYDILTSTTSHLLAGQEVTLIYHHFFFRRNCTVYNSEDADQTDIENYGILNKLIVCGNRTTTSSSSIYSTFGAGDSKLSFTIENWPFDSEEHMLRATYRYSSLQGVVDNGSDCADQTDDLFYTVNTGVRLQVRFLTTSVLDDSIGPVEIVSANLNEVTVLFHSFQDRLIYDPSLRFLLSSEDSCGTDPWISWRLPLISIVTVATLSIGFALVITFSPKVRHMVQGSESKRVEHLRVLVKHQRESMKSMQVMNQNDGDGRREQGEQDSDDRSVSSDDSSEYRSEDSSEFSSSCSLSCSDQVAIPIDD